MTISDPRSSGYLNQSRRSPTGLVLVIGLHGAALAIALLAKSGFVPAPTEEPPTTVVNIPSPAPPPEPLPQVNDPVEPPPIPTASPSPIPISPVRPTVPLPQTPIVPFDPVPIADPTPPEPVVRGAQFARGVALQPAYPRRLILQELEGSCTIRVRIAPNGRVIEAIPVDATHPAFCDATERHALRRWRFEPATRDGVPVESWQQRIVQFRLS